MAHFHKRLVKVLDSYISYIDTRAGEFTLVLLHGNIASKYIWHDVIPYIHGYGRCLAPDLLGMGNSGMSPTNEYGYEAQYRYIHEWIRLVLPAKEKFVLVGYEWGAALAFRWAYIHPERVHGLVLLEGIFCPIRSVEDVNSKLMQNVYITVQKHLSQPSASERDDVMTREFRQAVSALVATWPPAKNHISGARCLHAVIDLFRDLPILSLAPYDVITHMKEINDVIGRSEIPKVLLDADQGVYTAIGMEASKHWRNTRTVGLRTRAVPTDMCAEKLGQAVVRFLKSLRPQP